MSLAESFAQSGFAQFINTRNGRIVRVLAGLVLIAWGYTLRADTMGVILMVGGLVPFTAGAFNLCFISAMLGGPIRGDRISKSRPQ